MRVGFVSPVNEAADSQAACEWLPPVVGQLARSIKGEGASVRLFGYSHSVAKVEQDADGSLVLCSQGMACSMADSFRKERRDLACEISLNPPSVLHAHWTQFGHALAALDTGGPCVVTVHDAAKECAWFNSMKLRPVDWFCNWKQVQITREVFRRAQHLIAVSPYVEQSIRNKFNFHGEVRVIPNCVVPWDVSSVDKKIDGTCFDAPVFCSIGHWGCLKNIKSLLRAFGSLWRQFPAARLILIGSGLGKGEAAERWATRRKLKAGVEFRGTIPHSGVVKLLQDDVDILVHPSRSEGFGMTLVEALANGVAVIANRAGAMPWVLDEGKAGFLVDAEDVQELAGVMIEMLKDDDMRKKLTLYGYRMVKERFDPEKIARQHLSYYAYIIEENPEGLTSCG